MLNELNETLTEKVDIWALGCCIYYLSSKKNPFDSETPEKIKWNIRNLRIDNNMYMAHQQQLI
jgi:serine/threonine protein kinase